MGWRGLPRNSATAILVTDDSVREANRKRMAVDIARAIDPRKEKRDQMRRRANLRIVR
jgi:hypothetical protein